jgi:hypothetical protein
MTEENLQCVLYVQYSGLWWNFVGVQQYLANREDCVPEKEGAGDTAVGSLQNGGLGEPHSVCDHQRPTKMPVPSLNI